MKSKFFGKMRMDEIGKQEIHAFDKIYRGLGIAVEVNDGKPSCVRMEQKNEKQER